MHVKERVVVAGTGSRELDERWAQTRFGKVWTYRLLRKELSSLLTLWHLINCSSDRLFISPYWVIYLLCREGSPGVNSLEWHQPAVGASRPESGTDLLRLVAFLFSFHVSTFEVPVMKVNGLSNLTSTRGSKQEIDTVPLTSEEQYAINHTKIIKPSHRFGDHTPCRLH